MTREWGEKEKMVKPKKGDKGCEKGFKESEKGIIQKSKK